MDHAKHKDSNGTVLLVPDRSAKRSNESPSMVLWDRVLIDRPGRFDGWRGYQKGLERNIVLCRPTGRDYLV